MNRLRKKSSLSPMPVLIRDRETPSIDFLLYVAIRKSLELAGFYERLSRSMQSDALKALFNEMAQVKHKEVSCYHIAYGPVPEVFSKKDEHLAPFTLSQKKNDLPAINTTPEACRFAIEIEVAHFLVFARLAQLEPDLETKKLYLSVLQMHKMSLDFLEKRLLSCEDRSDNNLKRRIV